MLNLCLKLKPKLKHVCKLRSISSLLIAEHDNINIAPCTLNTISAAKSLGRVECFLGGFKCDLVTNQLKKIKEIEKLNIIDDKELNGFRAEVFTNAIVDLVKKGKYNNIIASSSSFSKGFIPRLAGKLNVSPITDVLKIEKNIYHRPIYAGNAIENVKSTSDFNIISIRSTKFDPVKIGSKDCAEMETINLKLDTKCHDSRSEFISKTLTKSDRPELSNASIVISGGRGLKSGKNFKILYELADKLKAAVGASRAAVDAGYVSNDLQIGQTGKIVAPDLYIAVGISGAIQHLAGMKDSKCIVAINTDPDAPIFQIADIGLNLDLFKVIPELSKML
ncbi:Alpha-ETF [Intoshia linei]|uniref:Electron transfer flavoprotein subunit alpha n=1 Tax=Intoshia linei TaxID=1819745 RepID=A0A177B586_9BILA|nr:Alpha-ETF [Intoshia linei]